MFLFCVCLGSMTSGLGHRPLLGDWYAVHKFAAIGNLDAIKQLDPIEMDRLTNKQETALVIAAEFGEADTVAYFIDNYPTMLHRTSEDGNNVLHIAVKFKQTCVVARLTRNYNHHVMLRCDCNPNRNGRTPIQEAVAVGFFEGLVIMLNGRPEAWACVDNDNRTLVHLAVDSRQFNILVYLLTMVSSHFLLVKNNYGDTALCSAVVGRSLEIVKLLYNANPAASDIPNDDDMTPFLQAVDYNLVSIIHYFMEQNPHVVEWQTKRGWNALHLTGDVDMAKKILAIKPDLIHVLTCDNENVLHMARDGNYVRFLLETEPNLLDAKNNNGQTPFQVAVKEEELDMINAILRCKPELIDTDSKGNTVLHIAVSECHNETIAMVFANRISNLYCINAVGDTPFHLAVSTGNMFALQMFKQHVTVETIVATHAQCVQDLNFDLQALFLRQCNSLHEHMLPELVDIVYVCLGLTVTKKRKHTHT